MPVTARTRPVPSDAAAREAWDQVMKLASKNALIVQAYGGVAVLAVPEEQRRVGIRDRCLRAELFAPETESQAELFE